LDDYEEGSFTPVISSAFGATVSYGEQLGIYVKIGPAVNFRIRIQYNSLSFGGGSTPYISGLPFGSTLANANSYIPFNSTGFTAIGTSLVAWIRADFQSIYLGYTSSGFNTFGSYAASEWPTGFTTIELGGSYIAYGN
jgi:hypothetical protein